MKSGAGPKGNDDLIIFFYLRGRRRGGGRAGLSDSWEPLNSRLTRPDHTNGQAEADQSQALWSDWQPQADDKAEIKVRVVSQGGHEVG